MYRRGDLGHVSRTLRTLDELRGFRRGRLLAEIARVVDASERTVRRDLTDLRAAGFEIESLTIGGRAAARLVEKTYSNISITRRERYTLLAIASLFDVLRGTPLWEDVASLQQKLAQRMSETERAEHASMQAEPRFAYVPDGGTKVYEGKEDILDALLTGVLSRRVVRFAYRGARGRAHHGFLAPYTMVLYKHGLYVIGCKLREPKQPIASDTPIAVYAVERFTDAEQLRATAFVPPAGFRIADVLNGAFGIHAATTEQPPRRVVIEFAAAKAAFVRARVWHPTQTFESLAGGGVRLAFTCTNLTPVVSWVLEWGPHARACEPAELVEQVVAELDAARRSYA